MITRQSDSAMPPENEDVLALADRLARAAGNPTHAPFLIRHAITADYIEQLWTDLETVRSLKDSDERPAKAWAKRALLTIMHEARASVVKKYGWSDPVRMSRYLVGVILRADASKLLGYATQMREALEKDTAPGQDTAALTRLREAQAAYAGLLASDSDDAKGTEAPHPSVEDLTKSIRRSCEFIRYAADSEWPYDDMESTQPRRAFGLPFSRPYHG